MPSFPSDVTRLTGYAYFYPLDDKDNISGEAIILPLPNTLNYQDTASFEDADIGALGVIGGAIAQEVNKEKFSLGDAIASIAANFSLRDAQSTQREILARTPGVKGRFISGATPNPNTRALFKQMGLRQFSFDYKFVPQNIGEAREIPKIIKAFRTQMHPGDTGIVDNIIADDGEIVEEINATYIMPNRFRIEFYLGNQLIEPQLKPCYLTAIQTSYNPSQNAILAVNETNPAFVETQINLTFREHKTLLNTDVKAGF